MSDRICTVPECEKPLGRGRATLCEMHYYRQRRGGSLEKRRQRKFCTECGGPAFGLGLCQSHYLQARRADASRPRCGETDCDKAAETRGYCGYHYARNCLPEWLAADRQSLERRAKVREWQQANPERMRQLNRNRKHRMRAQSAGVPVTKFDLAEILAEHGMVCHICGGDIASRADLHFDHVIPLSKGGPHTPENLRPSHAACNRRKGARLSA